MLFLVASHHAVARFSPEQVVAFAAGAELAFSGGQPPCCGSLLPKASWCFRRWASIKQKGTLQVPFCLMEQTGIAPAALPPFTPRFGTEASPAPPLGLRPRPCGSIPFISQKRGTVKVPLFCDGADGNRTRVRKSIHCPSTIIVCCLTFPPAAGNRHLNAFSSFMIRPYVQSLAYVVSRIDDARITMCGCTVADSRN